MKVKHVVFMSIMRKEGSGRLLPEITESDIFAEQTLKASGLNYTIVFHPPFSENLAFYFRLKPYENGIKIPDRPGVWFAAEFLMPANIFYKECPGKEFNPAVIKFLASRFNVNKTATIMQFVKRGNHPICVVYCKDNKMKWYKKSADFRPFLKYVPNTPPPPGTVAHELHTKYDLLMEADKQEDIWKSD